jgi:hypothetical protein
MWIAGAAAGMACCIIWAGSRFVYAHYALSMDEFMAEFDARIFASGRLFASVASDWRAYLPALQPIFRLELPENAYWVSSYLPMNAALRAIFVLLGAPAWEGIVLAGVAIAATYGVARRLWPERPDAALVSVILLVCSSQFLITAMTPYAMTAHLALNMVWLWLFLRDTRTSHAAAAGVAFVASGLHQVVFHPIFAAPFIASLAVARRWKLMTYYVAVYGLICLFWVLYWSLVLRAVDAPLAQSADVGMLNFIERAAKLIDLSPGNVSTSLFTVGLNLLRLFAWQSPLVVPLALAGLFAARERKATIVSLAAGGALTLLAVLVLMPFQGHGWGYRYLHGMLGSFSLIAAQGWISLTKRDAPMSRGPALAFVLNAAFSLLVLLPWHAYQAHAFVRPFASAVAAIEHSTDDVVVVDRAGIWYGEDLVRNDPFLRTTPKVLSLSRLDAAQLTRLCRRYRIAFFGRNDARRLGMLMALDTVDENRSLRAVVRSLRCGHALLGDR